MHSGPIEKFDGILLNFIVSAMTCRRPIYKFRWINIITLLLRISDILHKNLFIILLLVNKSWKN